MFYKLIRLLFLLLIIFLLPSKVLAAENFQTDFEITYTLTESITSHAKLNVTLTNKTTEYYASSYKIQLGFSDVSNLKVLDDDQVVTPTVVYNEKGTQVELDFVKKIVGTGNKHNFSITFDTNEIAQNSGNIWEVNIPGLDKESTVDSFNVNLVFPRNLGSFAYIKPQVKNLKQTGNTISFTRDDLKNSGLSIAFGDYQFYDFNLKYHLKNSNVVPTIYSIPIPPDTSYQQTRIDDIFPKPTNVVKDYDGNYKAQYLLSPKNKLDIAVKGQAKIFLKPKTEHLTQEQRDKYTKDRPYWQASDPKIKKLAAELKTAEKIYQYVSETLNYDFSRVKENQDRLGAKKVLDDPSSAVCLEFTDLFIAIARSAGIPAREVTGFAYTQNSKERPLSLIKDVLHAWPQYYDDDLKSWVMIDPTWANTTKGLDYFDTLDFDHVAFAIQGLDSDSPAPAGGYKLDTTTSEKDVDIKPSKYFGKTDATVEAKVLLSPSYTAGFPISSQIIIRNVGNSVSQNSFLLVSSYSLKPDLQNLKVPQIPPFGEISIPLTFEKKSFLTNEQATIKIQLGNRVIYQSFYIRPFFYNSWIYFGGFFIVAILTIAVLIYSRRSRGIPVQKPSR